MDADGTNVKRLTFSRGEDRGTSWSPDGSKIVFHAFATLELRARWGTTAR